MTLHYQVLTPKDRPMHRTIGRLFYSYDERVYYCESYDPRADFWMTNVVDPTDRHAVSPRAINRTYQEAGDSWKPQLPEDAIGREYYVIDTRVPPDQMKYVWTLDKDCFGLDDRIALFFWEADAKKFIEKVLESAGKLQAAAIARTAIAA